MSIEEINKLKRIKEISPEKAQKYRLITFAFINFYIGMFFVLFLDAIEVYLKDGLFHKIISVSGVNIPIGMIGMICLSVLSTLLFYSTFYIDMKILHNGLSWIKIKGEKKIE